MKASSICAASSRVGARTRILCSGSATILLIKGIRKAAVLPVPVEAIPITLAENAGLDPIDILSDLRSRHEKGETWAGIEVIAGKVQDMSKAGVIEPLAVKKQIIKSATEASTMILKIDDVIAAGKMKTPPTPPGGGPGGMPGGGYPGMGEY